MKEALAEFTVGLGPILDRNKYMRKSLAKELGVSEITVSRWCTGERTPGGRTILRMMAVLRRFEPRLRPEDLYSEGGHSAEAAS